MAATKTGSVVVQAVSVLLGLFFLWTGLVKFLQPEIWSPTFAAWGYPDWFHIVVGVAEMAGGALVLVPRTTWIGALLLAVVMAGAAATHLLHNEVMQAAIPGLLCITLGSLAHYRYPRKTPPA